MQAYGALAVAVVLWAALAGIVTELSLLPPLFLTGAAFCLEALPGLSQWRQLEGAATWLLASGGLFSYQLLLILALRWAPAVRANLLNYLWPLLIVLLTPFFVRGARLGWLHLLALALGFAGAAQAIMLRAAETVGAAMQGWGYAAAIGAAIIWALYTHYLRWRSELTSSIISGFCVIAGVMALLLHAGRETTPSLNIRQWGWLLLLGLGPMGCAFIAWDYACKHLDPRRVGVWSFATPVLSTACLLWISAEGFQAAMAGGGNGNILCLRRQPRMMME